MLSIYIYFVLFLPPINSSSSPQLDASLNLVTKESHQVMDQSITPTAWDLDLRDSGVLTCFCGMAQDCRHTFPFLIKSPSILSMEMSSGKK